MTPTQLQTLQASEGSGEAPNMKSKSSVKSQKRVARCSVCHKPASRIVDGEPRCEAHAGLVYENQVEDYIKNHLTNNEWLSLMSREPPGKVK